MCQNNCTQTTYTTFPWFLLLQVFTTLRLSTSRSRHGATIVARWSMALSHRVVSAASVGQRSITSATLLHPRNTVQQVGISPSLLSLPLSPSIINCWARPSLTCLKIQEVVTYMSPVEAFATRIKIFDQQQKCAWLLDWPSWGPWLLDFLQVKGQIVATCSWSLIFKVPRSTWSLDWLSKSALIAWFYFDPGHKHFYTEHISDYPLRSVGLVPEGGAGDKMV